MFSPVDFLPRLQATGRRALCLTHGPDGRLVSSRKKAKPAMKFKQAGILQVSALRLRESRALERPCREERVCGRCRSCAWRMWLRICRASGPKTTRRNTWTSTSFATLRGPSASWVREAPPEGRQAAGKACLRHIPAAASLVHELLCLKGKRLTRAMLHLLLVPQLTELSLSVCPKLVNNTIAQMITLRCKNLSSLDLVGCSRVPINALVNLMEGLPRLTKLYLEETQCNTQVLSAVGSCCRRLRELNISGCKRISPESLFHLAYDPTAGTFCCPDLQILSVDGLESKPYSDDLPWALAFLLLALPSLTFLENEFVAEAVCLVHDGQFERAQIPAGFPSMQELVQRKMSACGAEPEGKLMLPLREILEMNEPFLPSVRAVCPHLAKMAVLLEDGPGLSPSFLPWHQLTDLSLDCMGMKELAELLPLTASLGPQLQALSLDGFSLGEGPCVAVLLSHCPNLQKFSASFFYSTRLGHCRGAAGQDTAVAPCKFPQLRDVTLSFCDLHDSVPPPQVPALRASLASLLVHSPFLESLLLIGLPFSLDGLFEEVLEGASLHCLRYLSLVKCEVSSPTIHRLLSLDNPLSCLDLDGCPDIHRKDYAELLRIVSREHLDLQVKWK